MIALAQFPAPCYEVLLALLWSLFWHAERFSVFVISEIMGVLTPSPLFVLSFTEGGEVQDESASYPGCPSVRRLPIKSLTEFFNG